MVDCNMLILVPKVIIKTWRKKGLLKFKRCRTTVEKVVYRVKTTLWQSVKLLVDFNLPKTEPQMQNNFQSSEWGPKLLDKLNIELAPIQSTFFC